MSLNSDKRKTEIVNLETIYILRHDKNNEQ